MNGVAIVDLNKDGLLDIVATYSALRGTGGRWGGGEKLRVFINEGGFTFRPHTIKLLDSKVSPESFGRGQVPNFADFNGDGFLDLFVTRHAQMIGRPVQSDRPEARQRPLPQRRRVGHVPRRVGEDGHPEREGLQSPAQSFGDVNKDGFQFQEATDDAGLSALNWVYRDWLKFFDALPTAARAGARRPYFADAIFGSPRREGEPLAAPAFQRRHGRRVDRHASGSDSWRRAAIPVDPFQSQLQERRRARSPCRPWQTNHGGSEGHTSWRQDRDVCRRPGRSVS